MQEFAVTEFTSEKRSDTLPPRLPGNRPLLVFQGAGFETNERG